MKKLTDVQRELLYTKRNKHQMNLDALATVLNCTKQHIVDAQVGRELPDDVHHAIVDWMDY